MDQNPTTRPERMITGIAGSPGIAIGVAHLFLKDIPRVLERNLDAAEIPNEIERFVQALEKSKKQLNKILLFARQKVGDAKSRIFEAQVMVLEDQVLIGSVLKRIRLEKKNVEFVVSDEIGKYSRLMLAAADEYMHERAHEMDDLANRIIRNLQEKKLYSKIEGASIVVAHTLTPADTMILSRNHVLGYATDTGGSTSHAALISRSLKIPAAVGLGGVSKEVTTGDMLIIDGYSGTLLIHPSQEHVQQYEEKRERMLQFESKLSELKDLPATTTDGHSVELSANIELPDQLKDVVQQGSQGVGLYRTESLLIGRDDFPTEEEQYLEYKEVVDRLYPQRVIMRTFDIGGDKIAPEMAEEANPFLGWRGIRVCFDQPDLFMNQLRALLRASERKNLSVMFPMVTTLDEVRRAKDFVDRAKSELRSQKVKFDDDLPIGVMIEIPAAAMIAEQMAAEVDFLSIGSNDLIQYLLAVDRGNSLVSELYREFHPCVVMTLKHVIDAAHKNNIWIGLCGEMAGNPLATALLVGLGIDELSVVPVVLPEIKKIIRSLNYKETQKVARKALSLSTCDEVEAHLRSYLRKEIPDIPLDEGNN